MMVQWRSQVTNDQNSTILKHAQTPLFLTQYYQLDSNASLVTLNTVKAKYETLTSEMSIKAGNMEQKMSQNTKHK